MQFYGIIDRRQISVRKAAVLADGLFDVESRLKKKVNGGKPSTELLLIAAAVDRLTTLVWQQTRDGHSGRNPPKSVLAELIGKKEKEKNNSALQFDTAEEFEAARNKILNEVVKNG